MHYEEYGLFLGLISYPFSIDGKKLYNDILKGLFDNHKKNLNKCASPDQINQCLYSPVAYRMFGTHGLAILSLVDDYAFCSRIFNPNHISSNIDNEVKNKFQSVVITGISETSPKTTNLKIKAEKTFLRKKDRFPFIGIIRLKIDYRLLQKQGCKTIQAVRDWFTNKYKDSLVCRYISRYGVQLEYLIVDCFDNDELVVIAFSDKIGVLYEFLDQIRRLNCEDVDIPYHKAVAEKHIFASCHLNFGYHIEYNVNGSNNPSFLDVYDEKSNKITKKDKDALKINCLCETKPGHRIYFCEYIKEKFNPADFQRTITGGTIVHIKLPFEKIHKIEELCQKKNEGFQKHLRRIKITLHDPRDPKLKKHDPDNSEDPFDANSIIKEDIISKIEALVKKIGISKIVREKLLSLFRLYNNCCYNQLQYLYFEELNPALQNIEHILSDLENRVNIRELEEMLNEEIAALEEAFYNRIHNGKTPNTTLEYGGGIQQHLTAFNYTYKQLVGLLSFQDARSVYARITSAERVSSTRTHLNLNINHIIYPELFATTAWKEAANFSNRILLHKLEGSSHKSLVDLVNTWYSFEGNPDSCKLLQYELFQRAEFQSNDPVFRVLKEILSNAQTLKYFINDYIVYHMAFQRDYKLMWHFYLKTMLQTTNCYHSLGKIKRSHVVSILLRLLMVALRETGCRKKAISEFLEQRHITPYDHLLADIWYDSFFKIREASEFIFNTLNNYGFTKLSELITLFSEIQIKRVETGLNDRIKNPDLEKMLSGLQNSDAKAQAEICLNARKEFINQISEAFSQYRLIEPSKKHLHDKRISPDFIVCILFAYLQQIYTLDGMTTETEPVLKSVPRNDLGEIDTEVLCNQEICPTAIHILADPTSGFFIRTPDARNKYFALRTTLYRSLWNCRMKANILNK